MSSAIEYAVIVDGFIENTVFWDGVKDWKPPAGFAVPLQEAVEKGYKRKEEPSDLSVSAFVTMLMQRTPNLIPRIWASQNPVAANAAAILFTFDGTVPSSGERLIRMLVALRAENLITEDEISALSGFVKFNASGISPSTAQPIFV